MVHVGKKIEEVLRDRHIPVVEFARKINTNRNNVYSIFRRESIDTKLLQKVGEVLQYNFFIYISDMLYRQSDLLFINNDEVKVDTDLDEVGRWERLLERVVKIEEENQLLKERLADKQEIIDLLKK